MFDWALRSALFEVADVLCFSFDLELSELADAPDWFHVAQADCKAFATDATGGVYALVTLISGHKRYGIHADPRGRAAVLGTSVQETVAMVIALPYWRDLLKLAHGDLDHMRRLAETLEGEVQDDIPAIDDARAELWKLLPIEAPRDPVKKLRDLNATVPPLVVVLAQDGWQYKSLADRERAATSPA
jgi:hypothetical protein